MIKYNTQVLKPENIQAFAGRNTNYISYVIADTVLYVFLVNRKFIRLSTVHIDSGFLQEYKKLPEAAFIAGS